MKQLLQSLKTGETRIEDVPAPQVPRGGLLVQTTTSLVSAGTERMLVEFGKANLLDKARQQPDKVKMVLEKARSDGVAATLDAVRSKLDEPLALGYCNVGRVIESGAAVEGLKTGDRVVSNGKHAEIVAVPRNLCARIPDSVSDDSASFTVLAAIGLQGIRLVNPTLGECVVVTGLGLIGLLTVQMLRAQGCRVLGIDFDPQRLALAQSFGAEIVNPGKGEDPLAAAERFSRGRGVDAVIITASTVSNEPVSQAARMCRKRGRIVLVGVVGLELSRADFYEKELSFQVSCSYGPGRYDPDYEDKGQDYPIGFVRWTEQRNFEAVLDLMDSGAIETTALISHRFDIDDGADAMSLLVSDQPALGILLDYPNAERAEFAFTPKRSVALDKTAPPTGRGVAFIGAGNYAGRVLMPAFRTAGADFTHVVSSGGVSAVHYGKKFGFRSATTEFQSVLDDPGTSTIVVATRHDAHARQVLAGLRAGKHVFCEKPLCLTLDELAEIESEANTRPEQRLMVGFNRRFSPLTIAARKALATVSAPKSVVITVNAGAIPSGHWTQDPEVGGGRIVGEGCHFIDLARHLAGSPIVEHTSHYSPGQGDVANLLLRHADGSISAIHYLANGHKSFPKERIEVFAGGRILRIDNFLRLRGWGWPGLKNISLVRQDKGQAKCAKEFLASMEHGAVAPLGVNEIIEVSQLAILLANPKTQSSQ